MTTTTDAATILRDALTEVEAFEFVARFGRKDKFDFRVPGTSKSHKIECAVLESSDALKLIQAFAAERAAVQPAGDAEISDLWHECLRFREKRGIRHVQEFAKRLLLSVPSDVLWQIDRIVHNADENRNDTEIVSAVKHAISAPQEAKAEQGDDDWEKDATAAGLIVNGLAVSGARLNAFFNGHRAGYARAQSAVATPSSVTTTPATGCIGDDAKFVALLDNYAQNGTDGYLLCLARIAAYVNRWADARSPVAAAAGYPIPTWKDRARRDRFTPENVAEAMPYVEAELADLRNFHRAYRTPTASTPPAHDQAEPPGLCAPFINMNREWTPEESANLNAILAKYPPENPVVIREGHPDDMAVDHFALAMKAKMAASREKGRGGWDDTQQCTTDFLRRLLVKAVRKGDPVDVGNFAMMLFHRGARTLLPNLADDIDKQIAVVDAARKQRLERRLKSAPVDIERRAGGDRRVHPAKS